MASFYRKPTQAQIETIIAKYPRTLPSDRFWQEDLKEAVANADHFVEPDDATSYADYRYVGTHNAFAYNRLFPVVRQQDQTIIGHLGFGVRGLMLDTYDWSDAPDIPAVWTKLGSGDVVLSHNDVTALSILQKGALYYQTLKYELRRVAEFMKANPRAVVTIFLEDRASATKAEQEIKEAIDEAGLGDGLIFRPADLAQLGGEFPTLGWMRTNNRRLVIFTQVAPGTSVTFNEFNHCYENNYGTSDENELCSERAESAAAPSTAVRPLVVFNHFPGGGQGSGVTPTTDMQKWRIEYNTARNITRKARGKHFAKGREFNGYWADRVIDCVNAIDEEGGLTIFDYVNELNGGYEGLVEFGTSFNLAADKPVSNGDRLAAIHQTHSGGTYYGWAGKKACPHRIEPVQGGDRGAYIADGAHVYLRTTQEAGGYVYLNAEGWKNLYYNNNAGRDEEWIVERVNDLVAGPIKMGEAVRLKSVRQSEDNGEPRYLSIEGDQYLATRSATNSDSENKGTVWRFQVA